MSDERERIDAIRAAVAQGEVPYEPSFRLLLDALDTAEQQFHDVFSSGPNSLHDQYVAIEERAKAAERQRDTLRTALIEAQSWIERIPLRPERLLDRIAAALADTEAGE